MENNHGGVQGAAPSGAATGAAPQAATTNPYDQLQHAAMTPTRFDDRMSAAMQSGQNYAGLGQASATPATDAAVGKVSAALAVVLGLVAVAGLAFGIWGIISSVMANNAYKSLETQINSLRSEITSLNETIINLESADTTATTESTAGTTTESTTGSTTGTTTGSTAE